MEHEHDGGADGRRGAGVGAGAAAPAMLGAAGTVLDVSPAGAVASRGGPLREPPAVSPAPAGRVVRERAERLRARLWAVREARARLALARAMEAGGLEDVIGWLFALSPLALAGAVVDTLREWGELSATLAALDEGELDAGAVVDRVAFGSLSRLRAVADRAMGPRHGADDAD